MYSQAMRSTVRKVKEKPGTHLTMESAGILWRGYPRWDMST